MNHSKLEEFLNFVFSMNEHLSVLGINLATLLDIRLRYVKKVRNHCARVITVDGNLK